MKTDLQIAQENIMEKIDVIAKKANIDMNYLEMYENYKAKVNLALMGELKEKKMVN